MKNEQLINFLRNTNLVSTPIAERIALEFIPQKIAANHFVLREGVISDEYIFLESGFMRAFVHDIEGNEVTTNFYSANQLVVEVSSFFTRTKSKENIQALADSVYWAIDYEQLNNLFHTQPEFREFGRFILVKAFATFKTRVLSMITETAEARYEALIKSSPEIFQYAALKHIASYLGITDTSLSRIRTSYKRK